jgi:uncharacterized protein YehS (DUF1456 family)
MMDSASAIGIIETVLPLTISRMVVSFDGFVKLINLQRKSLQLQQDNNFQNLPTNGITFGQLSFDCALINKNKLSFSINISINNMLLLSIAFSHKSFDSIAIMASFVISFGRTEHYLRRKRRGEFHEFKDHSHARLFDGLALRHQFINPPFQRQSLCSAERFACFFGFRQRSAHSYFFLLLVAGAAAWMPCEATCCAFLKS